MELAHSPSYNGSVGAGSSGPVFSLLFRLSFPRVVAEVVVVRIDGFGGFSAMRRTMLTLAVIAALGLFVRLGQVETGPSGLMGLALITILALILRGGQVLAFLAAACSGERFPRFRKLAVH